MPELIDLVRRFPEIPVILNHVGTPLGLACYQGRREERFPTWLANIKELAKSLNVSVKLGGLGRSDNQLDSMRQAAYDRAVLQPIREGHRCDASSYPTSNINASSTPSPVSRPTLARRPATTATPRPTAAMGSASSTGRNVVAGETSPGT